MADPGLRDAIDSSQPPKVALPAYSLHLNSLTGNHLKLCYHLDVLLIEKRGHHRHDEQNLLRSMDDVEFLRVVPI